MKPQPKPERREDKKYLQWILTLPCAKCSRIGWIDENSKRQGMMYHHQPAKGDSSMSTKADDRRAIPLCCNTICGKGCHEKYGEKGRDTFWAGRDVEGMIADLNRAYEMTRGKDKP